MRKKISLIGAGNIGGTLAHLIALKKLGDIKKNAKFIKITKAGFYESMVHSVEMIEPTLN